MHSCNLPLPQHDHHQQHPCNAQQKGDVKTQFCLRQKRPDRAGQDLSLSMGASQETIHDLAKGIGFRLTAWAH